MPNLYERIFVKYYIWNKKSGGDYEHTITEPCILLSGTQFILSQTLINIFTVIFSGLPDSYLINFLIGGVILAFNIGYFSKKPRSNLILSMSKEIQYNQNANLAGWALLASFGLFFFTGFLIWIMKH